MQSKKWSYQKTNFKLPLSAEKLRFSADSGLKAEFRN